jgi:hypothetical protein
VSTAAIGITTALSIRPAVQHLAELNPTDPNPHKEPCT